MKPLVPAAIAFALMLPSLSHAGNLTGTLSVKLTMVNGCKSISATPLDFGVHRYPERPADVTAVARIHANCSRGTGYTIELDNGHHPGAGEARLMTGAFTRPYHLYKDPGMTQEWGSGRSGGTGVTATMGPSETAVHTVYGRVRLPRSGPPGVATDAVTITLSY